MKSVRNDITMKNLSISAVEYRRSIQTIRKRLPYSLLFYFIPLTINIFLGLETVYKAIGILLGIHCILYLWVFYFLKRYSIIDNILLSDSAINVHGIQYHLTEIQDIVFEYSGYSGEFAGGFLVSYIPETNDGTCNLLKIRLRNGELLQIRIYIESKAQYILIKKILEVYSKSNIDVTVKPIKYF